MYLKLNKQRHLEKPHPGVKKRALPTGMMLSRLFFSLRDGVFQLTCLIHFIIWENKSGKKYDY